MSPGSEDLKRPTVLHVEDDANDVLLMQHACHKIGDGVTLQSVLDGDEAIAYLAGAGKYSDRTLYPTPELVLLDLKMPRVNGFEVLAWIRREMVGLPVVVFTSSNHEADVVRAYELGASSYLVKPVGFDALVEMLQMIEHYWLRLNQRPGE